jgi:hypothetical protein
MRKLTKEMKDLTLLNVPVPPMLSTVMGYPRDARFISLHCKEDEIEYSDGRMIAIGSWGAYFIYIQHPAVKPHLTVYDVGYTESEAKHALILDREKLELYIAPVKAAEAFLIHQALPKPRSAHSDLIDEMRQWLNEFLKTNR